MGRKIKTFTISFPTQLKWVLPTSFNAKFRLDTKDFTCWNVKHWVAEFNLTHQVRLWEKKIRDCIHLNWAAGA